MTGNFLCNSKTHPRFAPMTAASLLQLEDSLLNSSTPSLSRTSSGYFSPYESDGDNPLNQENQVQEYHMNSKNEYVCMTCGKTFQKLVGLRSHEVTHAGTICVDV